MGEMNLAVALLILAIIFSAISIILIVGIVDLDSKISFGSQGAPVLEGSQAGKVNLYVVSNTGVSP